MADPTSPNDGTAPKFNPDECLVCGAAPEKGHATPLCRNHRTELARRPLPWWVTFTLLGFTAIGIAGFYFQWHNLKASVYFDKGERAEKNAKFADAVENYSRALHLMGDSPKLRIRLAKCYHADGEDSKAIENIKTLQGRKLPTAVVREANEIIADIERGNRDADPR